MAKHNDRSLHIIERLSNLGLPHEVQLRLGTLAVVWNQFETSLERTLWAVTGEKVAGSRPWTDKVQVSDWIIELGKDHGRLSAEWIGVLRTTSEAARDLMEYRHAVFHGWLVLMPTSAIYIRNPRWHGEERRRPTHDAHVDANLLDMGIDAGWTLCQVMTATQAAIDDREGFAGAAELLPRVRRARLQLAELRNLTSYMNHEKN